ncbi:Pimeloyl-ACP methyl ester carboxylesterase [Palleronia salina]|uniref:Pimeloyl-ACP methyl ester carboxylesterase n=1 Tax=Palleronia salina TaxID=313368 RepID=A0A1M6B0J9_9RHOB|nr:alpha/beta fold hydrolase [Palleronia salina]SHI42240.1 Pimeloyl-ACP methyl ester carboxylesterase [Palleronia salina]
MTLPKLVGKLAVAGLLLAGCTALVDRRIDSRVDRAEAAFPPLGDFVEVDGRRVHYRQMGQGPDLVLIHGASGNLRDFTFAFADRMADRFRVTVFDRPGLGYTQVDPALVGPWGDRGETPQSQAALLAGAARAIGVERPVVAGHSYGGAVTMAWALNHAPAAAVVISGATQPWPGGLGPLYTVNGSKLGGSTVVPLISAFATDGLVRDAVASIFAPQDPPEGYLDYVGAPLTLRPASFRANARQVNTLRPQVVEMQPRYGQLDLPLEIVHGTADDVVPIDIHSEGLVEQVPGARLTRLEGVGHMPHHVAAEAVADAIDRAARRAGVL